MSLPISIVMIAKNESRQMAEALNTAKGWADEIVVVDDESTDNTREIAGQFTDKIFTRKMDLEGPQRNFAASKAKNDWVMILDCDERITDELKVEIEGILKNWDQKTVAYWVPQISYLGHYHLKHGGWANPHVRLYNRKHFRFKEIPQDLVHPGLETDEGFTGAVCKGHLIHYNFASVEDYIRKINRQTTLEALKWHISKKKMGTGRAIWRMVDRFFRRFIGKGGWKDGYYGFVAAVCSGFYEFAAYSKLREIRDRGAYIKEYGVEDLVKESELAESPC